MNKQVKLSAIKKAIEFKDLVNSEKPTNVCIYFDGGYYSDTEISKSYENAGLTSLDYLLNLHQLIVEKEYNCDVLTNYGNLTPFNFEDFESYVTLRKTTYELGANIDVIDDCNDGGVFSGEDFKDVFYGGFDIFFYIKNNLHKN